MATFKTMLHEYVAGCFTGIWIETHEPEEAIAELGALCREQSWQLGQWNIDQGLRTGVALIEEASDPLSAVKSAGRIGEGTSILVLENFHRFLALPDIVHALAGQLHAGKQTRSIIIVVAPVLELPPELEKRFVVVEHALPDRDQLRKIAEELAIDEGELPEAAELDQLIDAASGMTRSEAESAYSLSLVRSGRLLPTTVRDLKTQTLKKRGLLSLYRGPATFDDLGGLDSLKSFCKWAALRSSERVRARGVMLLSPPGCGKSQICKALGSETGRPVILLDVGSLMGSLVGQSENRTRQALKIIDAMGKSVVLLDEVDKAFGSVTSGNSGDSGVSARMFGTFLTWLNDRQSDSFVVCTANDVQKLTPEFARAERFDAVYFLDLPLREEKDSIWSIYLEHFGLDVEQAKPDDSDWSGAEIKACCRLAALLDVPLNLAQNVVPVAVTARESIDRLRRWADQRCLDAHAGGLYRFTPTPTKTRRKIKGDPSLN